MSTNLTLEDIEQIQALVDRIDQRIQDYLKTPSGGGAGCLGSAVAQAREFLNGYAAALKHLEKKGEAA